MRVDEFFRDLREDIGDGVSPYRWTDPDLLRKVNSARSFLYGKRPAFFYVSEIITSQPAAIEDAREEIDIITSAIPCLQSYVAYLVLREDVDDSAAQEKAEAFLKAFKEQV